MMLAGLLAFPISVPPSRPINSVSGLGTNSFSGSQLRVSFRLLRSAGGRTEFTEFPFHPVSLRAGRDTNIFIEKNGYAGPSSNYRSLGPLLL